MGKEGGDGGDGMRDGKDGDIGWGGGVSVGCNLRLRPLVDILFDYVIVFCFCFCCCCFFPLFHSPTVGEVANFYIFIWK